MATPLEKKLGIKEKMTILVLNQPQSYIEFFHEFPGQVQIHESELQSNYDFIHIFVKSIKELEDLYYSAKKVLSKSGMLWISWPKKSSKIDSEVDKPMIMDYGLANGLVDVKVCSIDDSWSAHKFVYRLKDR